MKTNPLIRQLAWLAIAAVAIPVGASAQVLEEVIVTAQKREQNIQDVGIAITAFSGDQIEALGMTNTTEIIQQVPGLEMVAWSPTLTTFNIRGVSQNNFTDNLEAPVAVYIDDAYVASMNGINGQMFDMERVEVLRGPQGTLFGRNATGGVIAYHTRRANEDELNGYFGAGAGEFGLFSVEGAIGGSFSDTARFRFAARSEESDGYIEAAPFPEGNPLPSGGGNLGGSDGFAIRAALQFDIGDAGQLDLMYKFSRDDKVPTGGYSFLPYADNTDPRVYIPPEFEDFVVNVIEAPIEATPDIFFCQSQLDCFAPVDTAGRTVFEGDHPTPHLNFADYAGFMDRDVNTLTADFEYELSNGMQLTSITSWSNVDKFYTEDGDGIPIPIIEFTTVADFTQFSQELRLSGSTDTMRWQAGVYYLDIDYDGDVLTRGAPVAGVAFDLGFDPDALTNPGVAQDNHLNSRNWSVFGQGEWDLSDAVTLIAGVRYSQDDKDMSIVTSFESPDDDILIPGIVDIAAEAAASGSDRNKVDYGDYAARLQLDYRFDDDTLLFASFNRGIKGGNFAAAADISLDRLRHEEEVLHAFEAGIKTDLADGKARLNATAFYYDYEDYQAFTFFQGTPNVTNADAKNVGAEVELFLMPTENWDIVLGASMQNSEVNNVQTTQDQVTPVGFVVDWPVDILNGVELPNTPSFAFNYLVRYNFDVAAGNLALQVDGYYNGDQYLEVTNGGAARQDAYNVVNARATWTSDDDRWEVTGYVRNLNDEVYKQYALDLGILGGTVYYAPPRWSGLNIAYNW
jgi:iron complex outermembrane receptor protein